MADSASRVASDTVGREVTRVRWTVVALLFGATTVNYMDRQVLGILAPTLTRELGWRETDYAAIVSWSGCVLASMNQKRKTAQFSVIQSLPGSSFEETFVWRNQIFYF